MQDIIEFIIKSSDMKVDKSSNRVSFYFKDIDKSVGFVYDPEITDDDIFNRYFKPCIAHVKAIYELNGLEY